MKRLTYLAAATVVAATTFPVAAQQQPSTPPQARVDSPRIVLKTPTTRFATIEGVAMRVVRGSNATTTVTDAPTAPAGDRIPNILVRLRDARYGRSVDTQFTDKEGGFLFRAVEPGNYMVEIVGTNQSAIAVTQLISANAGETIAAVVRLPGSPSALAALLGEQAPAALTATQAGVTGLLPGAITQLPLVVLQSLPAVVAVDTPSSER